MPIPLQLPAMPQAKWFDPDPDPLELAWIAKKPGHAVNTWPFETIMRMDFTTPIGVWTGVSYSLFFQLPKWGFVRYKIQEWLQVSPAFREYYEITMKQRDQLEAIIKQGLSSIATAFTDMELIWHDLRKYKENLDHFQKIERGKWLIKHGKRGEAEKLIMEGQQTLKAIFIDEVDVHTGEMISMKSIAPRWPTIIADFMQLKDNETNPKEIAKKMKVSEAEGVVLATKNKLFLEWRDRLFKDTLMRRYRNMTGLLEARKASVNEYKEMLRPTLARYKMINDALTDQKTREILHQAWYRPDTQAISADFMRLWAWKPMVPSEKYSQTRYWLHKIKLGQAGFTKEEISELKRFGVDPDKTELFGLPIEPSIDEVVRKISRTVEKEYKVKITIKDVLDARNMLANHFEKTWGGFGGGEPWAFSPYYIFFDIPMLRTVLRLPNGNEVEDVQMEDIISAIRSQNFIIINCLELKARQKLLDNFVNSMLGEISVEDEKGKKRMIPAKEIMEEEYPELFIEGEKELEKKMSSLERIKEKAEKADEIAKQTKENIQKILDSLGLGDITFLRSTGPYEYTVVHRMAKEYHTVNGRTFALLRDFLRSKFGVPGVAPTW